MESLYTTSVQTPGGEVILFNPLDGNWDCLLLDQAMVDALESRFNGENGMADWDDLPPTTATSATWSSTRTTTVWRTSKRKFSEPTRRPRTRTWTSSTTSSRWPTQPSPSTPAWVNPATNRFSSPRHAGPFNGVERSWFMMDMDGDGLLNGPSDWDTDGDGMPDGFEYCYSDSTMAPNAANVLNPANASDGYGDWDEDGMNNLEEYSGRTNLRRATSPRLGWQQTRTRCRTSGRLRTAFTHARLQTVIRTPTWTGTIWTATVM